MPSGIRSSDVQELAAIAAALKTDYSRSGPNPWTGSPFAWIRTLSSRRRGKVGEQTLSGYLAARNFTVGPSTSPAADRIVNGKLVEVKFSTLWETGVYKFQQIRNQEYDLMICLGISPFNAHCWVMPKATLRRHVFGKFGQHSGKGASETSWISLVPARPPAWMRPLGGTLRSAVQVLRRLAPEEG